MTDIRQTCTTDEALEWLEERITVDLPTRDYRALMRCRAALEAIKAANDFNPAVVSLFDEEGFIPVDYAPEQRSPS